jgi:hypothetical protein
MYGKPEWFLNSNSKWFVRPNSWQGWAYAFAWVAAMLLPSLALIGRDQAPEAAVWMLLSAGLWLWDSATIRKANQARAAKEVFYIGDDVA